MRGGFQAPDRWLSLAFLLMVLLFALATMVSQQLSGEIEHDSRLIADDAAPSIQYLSRARSSLAIEQLRLDDYLEQVLAGQPRSVVSIEEPWRRLNEALGAYAALPPLPNERVRWDRAAPDLAELTRQRNRVLQLTAMGKTEDAVALEKSTLDRITDRVRGRLDELIALDAAYAAELGAQIRVLHNRARDLALALDALAGLITLGVAMMALRQARRSRRQLEYKNQELEARGVELEAFSGRMAHDVLSPLFTAGIGWELACKLYPEDPRLAHIAQTSRAAIQRSRRLVEDLLAFSLAGARPPDQARTDVAPVMADVLTHLTPEAEQARIALISTAFPSAQVACSAGVLTSILLNLVRNAIKHMDDAKERRITVSVRVALGHVLWEVSDTGKGIPFEQQQEIFEPYVRGNTHAPGIGLGLATVKRLVASHQGRVGVRSTPGEGSTFWFELPLLEPERARAPAEPSPLPESPPTFH